MSSSRFPLFEAVLAGMAGASLAALYVLPSTPYLAPTLRPWALGLSFVWTLWRLVVLERRYNRYQAWRVSPTWVTTPSRLSRRSGVLLGKGFRWQAPHVETLERMLLLDGSLPEGRGERGGYPALQVVGQADEEEVEMSWTQLTTHLGLFGTTGSGKSRGLEIILAQTIGAD